MVPGQGVPATHDQSESQWYGGFPGGLAQIPRLGDILRWQAQENVPGHFPFTAGVFPRKREAKIRPDVCRRGGSRKETNRRFHYIGGSTGQAAVNCAFDSVTLYGEDPGFAADIYE